MFDIVVALNAEKLRGRLQSKKHTRPAYWKQYIRAANEPWLTNRLSKYLAGSNVAPEVLENTRSIREHLLEFEEAPKYRDLDALKSVVRAVFEFDSGPRNLSSQMQSLRAPKTFTEGQEIHEISQIPKYLGVCRMLSKCCRLHPSSFANVMIEVVQTYRSGRSIVRPSLQLHVHAEVQLVVHFELHQQGRRPRIIGSSKDACYLCHSFVKAHGLYYLSRTHGVFYTRWTVPDLQQYKPASRDRLKDVMLLVKSDVLAAQATSGKHILSEGPWVFHSGVDIGKDMLSPLCTPLASSSSASSGSMSSEATIRAPSDDHDDRVAAQVVPTDGHVPSEPSTTQQYHLHTCEEHAQSRGCVPSIMVDEAEGKVTYHLSNLGNNAPSYTRSSATVTAPSEPRICNGIEVFVEHELPTDAQQHMKPNLLHDLVTLLPASDTPACDATVDVDTLTSADPGLEIWVAENRCREVSILLRCEAASAKGVKMRCYWPQAELQNQSSQLP